MNTTEPHRNVQEDESSIIRRRCARQGPMSQPVADCPSARTNLSQPQVGGQR